MKSLYGLLIERCGLTPREAGLIHHIDARRVRNWIAGRSEPPQRALDDLHILYRRIEAAAQEYLAEITRRADTADQLQSIELAIAADHSQARAVGWPCVGARRAMIGLIAARTPMHLGIKIADPAQASESPVAPEAGLAFWPTRNISPVLGVEVVPR